MKTKRLTLIYIFLFILLLPILSTHSVNAQDEPQINLRRTFGMAFGKYIQGSFTIEGSGDSTITNLSITFNELEVANSSGNSISYRFKTKDYKSGEYNITLWGSSEQFNIYSISIMVNFMSPTVSMIATIGIVSLVLTAVIFKYGPRIRTKISNKFKGLKSDQKPISNFKVETGSKVRGRFSEVAGLGFEEPIKEISVEGDELENHSAKLKGEEVKLDLLDKGKENEGKTKADTDSIGQE